MIVSMSLIEQAGYLYLRAKDLAKENKDLESLRKEKKKIEALIGHAAEDHKEKYHEKVIYLERRIKKVALEREAILKRLRQHHDLFTEFLYEEERD